MPGMVVRGRTSRHGRGAEGLKLCDSSQRAATYLGLSGVASDSLEGGGSGRESRSPERSSQGGRTEAHGSRHCGCRCTGRGTGSRERRIDGLEEENRRKLSGLKKGQRKERKGGAKFGRADGWWTPEIADVNWLGVAARHAALAHVQVRLGETAAHQCGLPAGRRGTSSTCVPGGGSQLSFKTRTLARTALRVVFDGD